MNGRQKRYPSRERYVCQAVASAFVAGWCLNQGGQVASCQALSREEMTSSRWRRGVGGNSCAVDIAHPVRIMSWG